MSTPVSKKALSSPIPYSPASTVATDTDYMSPRPFFLSEAESSYLAAPLLSCDERLYDELPLDSYSRFRFGASMRLRAGFALLAAFAFGLFAGSLFGFNFHTITAFFQYPHLRGGCWWKKRGIAPGTRVELIVHNRSVLAYMPYSAITGPKPEPVPAIVVLHGSEDTAVNIANKARFEQVAEAHNPGFLLIYPEMQHYKGLDWGYSDPKEMAFFSDLPSAVANAGFPIDQTKVFVAGHSSGGSMALYLQNNLPGIFNGAAAVEAGVGHLRVWQNKSFGRPAMVVWNHNDNVLAEYGGESLYQQTIAHLRRHDPSTRFGSEAGPRHWKQMLEATSSDSGVVYANRLYWPAVGNSPPLAVVSWQSASPTHNWSNPVNVPGSFDAASQIWSFFQEPYVDAGSGPR